MTPQLWATIAVAVIGVAGTLAAALLTQTKAANLEQQRWSRERDREEARYEMERARDHELWLRNNRQEIYAELVRASSQFFVSLPGPGLLADRCEDTTSEIYVGRETFFEVLYRARFIAGPALQTVIRRALDNAENVGHDPYFGDPPRQRTFQSEMIHEAYAVTRELEVAARAELGLPPPVQDSE
ncbi:hypothetical protein [Actinopolymorpha pittospori]|uniref:Uncharacterized protein n=1 Tax=Actinopolymorpha pittospori TaxID=648752 RepID=A0A927MVS9_9ACTN|nr:hypothetical protein [Actinopolymorpha pittospori]MBE1605713.1 hypothetical protein [Actinopolymorpha pittospori]